MIESTNLTRSMLATVSRYEMLNHGDRVLIAVSGGPDSVSLLHALWSVREEFGFDLHVAHLNHSIRDEASDADAEYVRQLASSLGIECSVERVDVPGVQKTLRLSLEEAARLVRYEFLDRVADLIHADRIALGHTADDQVETVLLNLLRGSGVDGLSGMPPVRGRIVRPLIRTRRTEVEAYISQFELHPRIDATNLVPAYTRNKVRLELLPLLRKDFNPEIDSGILRLSELASEDTAYLNEEAERVLRQIMLESEGGSAVLELTGWSSRGLAIRRRLVRASIRHIKGGTRDIGFIHIDALLRLLDTGSDFRYGFPGGLFVERAGSKLSFMSERPQEESIHYCIDLEVPGRTLIREIGAAVGAETVAGPAEPRRPRGSLDVVLDYGAIVGKLKARNWIPGDRIRPLGMTGSKKVQDIFVDSKIPRASRHKIPIIVDDRKILWVAGLAVSDEAKVTESASVLLRLNVEAI